MSEIREDYDFPYYMYSCFRCGIHEYGDYNEARYNPKLHRRRNTSRLQDSMKSRRVMYTPKNKARSIDLVVRTIIHVP